MTLQQFVFIGILGVHILLTCIMCVRVVKTNLLTTPQKTFNIILLFLLPLVWLVLMYYMLRKEPVVFDEEEQHKRTTHGFYESGKGFLGPGHH